MNQLIQTLRYLFGSLWLVLSLFVTIGVVWWALAQAHFLYPVWHDHAGIAETIERHAPDNHFKSDFALTSADTRYQLFAGIVGAIHQQGEGLTQLTYQTPEQTVPLLRPVEIEHLKAVAAIVERGTDLWWWGLLAWALLTAMLLWQRWTPPPKQAWWLLLGLGVVGGLAWLTIGLEAVFYALNEALFPASHQWLFDYEESLMTTLMQAPDLFTWIGATWLGLTLVGFAMTAHAVKALENQLVDKHPPYMV
jgi:hypothetical protein